MAVIASDPSCSRDEEPRSSLSEEEQKAAEESLKVYCKPVDLYRILHRRATRKPLFLQRCLLYKIQEKNESRLSKGTVSFNFRYYNNRLKKIQVTEDFSCPFCFAKCASFKGLKWHLNSSHNLFDYEFWVNEEDYHVVIVFHKTDACTSEILGSMVHPRKDTFFFCNKPLKRRSRNQNANPVGPLASV